MEQVGKGMVDMQMSPEELKENMPIMGDVSNRPRYPYGLSICIGHNELEKLGVDYSDWNVGDHFHLECLAKITSISENETEGGKNCRVELQIVALKGQDEEESGDDDDGD